MRSMKSMYIPLAVLLVLSACSTPAPQNKKSSAHIPVINILAKDVSLEKVYVTDIEAIQNVEIRSRIPGFLEKIHVDEGGFVKKGQLLFSISGSEYRSEVEKAKASLNSAIAESKTAELESEKVKLLVEKKIVSPTELDVAKAKLRAMQAKVEEARAALTHAQTKLSYTEIRAPYDGVIDRIPLKVGSLLEEGTFITSVSDISSVFAYFNISENEYLQYLRAKNETDSKPPALVELILSDGHEYEFKGKIETVVSEFQETTGSIAFRARFPNPHFLLKHGATGKVKLTNELHNALMLPQKSVFEIQDKNYVFVVDANNKVQMRNFVPRTRINDFYIVQSGLRKGERVVYEGIQNVKDGMLIAPRIVHLDSMYRNNIL